MKADERFPVLAVIRRALIALRLRWPLYVSLAIATFALQFGIESIHTLTSTMASVVESAVVFPLVLAIAIGFVAADLQAMAGAVQIPDRAIWERIAERAWAVVVIEGVTVYFAALGQSYIQGGELIGIIFFTGVLMLSVVLLYADVHAIVEPDLRASQLLQASVLASARLALTAIGYRRALVVILVEQFLPFLALLVPVTARPLFMDSILAIVIVPIAAFTTAIYLDMQPVGKERK